MPHHPGNAGDARAAGGKNAPNYKLGRRDERAYYCRTCSTEEHATEVPPGWYRIERKADYGDGNSRTSHAWVRLGLYCSADCMFAQRLRLSGIERSIDPRDTAEWKTKNPHYTRFD